MSEISEALANFDRESDLFNKLMEMAQVVAKQNPALAVILFENQDGTWGALPWPPSKGVAKIAAHEFYELMWASDLEDETEEEDES